jgi:hypothetical protein
MTSRTSGNGHGDSVFRISGFQAIGISGIGSQPWPPTLDGDHLTAEASLARRRVAERRHHPRPRRANPPFLPHRPHFRKYASQFFRKYALEGNCVPFHPESPRAHPVRARIFGKCALQLGPDSRTDPFVNAVAHRECAHFLKRTPAS